MVMRNASDRRRHTAAWSSTRVPVAVVEGYGKQAGAQARQSAVPLYLSRPDSRDKRRWSRSRSYRAAREADRRHRPGLRFHAVEFRSSPHRP